MIKSETMYLIRAANVLTFDAAEEVAQREADSQLAEDNATWEAEEYEPEEYEPLEYDAEFPRHVTPAGDILVDNEPGAPGQDNYFLLVQDGLVVDFLNEHCITFETVQAIEKKIVELNPIVIGSNDFYILDGDVARLHHVGDLIEN